MIKVGYLISYDYDLIFPSLLQVYDHVSKIVIAIDKNRKTWTGNAFEIPQSFFDQLTAFDHKRKIVIYEDDFSIPELTPMQNETRERNMLSKKMGRGWLMQLDVDEYIYEFDKVAKHLRKLNFLLIWPKMTPVIFRARLITLYRKLDDGFLFIDNEERFPFVTNYPHYTIARDNGEIKSIFTGINVIHQSWAREEGEILQKIKNWGHSADFDVMKYFEFWKTLNSSNYLEHKNIHPIIPKVWNELHFLKSTDINDFINKYALANPQRILPLKFKKQVKLVLQYFLKTI